ncbi:hypothetical protein THASP1DRAFT_32032 [Thamnocephalis sphaerospora]|uniref:F-box domain-containing protein n=1 Tax=Thamnocephalis sphaerospora TaxID=78915 RepID=A0A4P9XK76_9FUNG|nr:hypothetical protein THASP1DRAFT_32032 [Thamnocephalis sphaerospora]|eukprot:RKP06146.1 hypothetical protein THASP1DRAFT_32032 [Thamnocephalis sphaerospora]
MDRVPEEVFDHLISAADEDALVVLSRTSKQMRTRIVCRQWFWRKRYEQQFPQSDKDEAKWLYHYMRLHKAISMDGKDTNTSPSIPDQTVQLDWFNVYCKRRTTEHIWSRDTPTIHQLNDVSSVRPKGTRICSIPYIHHGISPEDVRVASQWVEEPKKQPLWILEKLCWAGLFTKHMGVLSEKHSNDYLPKNTNR